MIPIPDARREEWAAVVVNPDGSTLPLPLDADQPGTITWQQDQQSPVGAHLTCHGTPPELRHGQTVHVTYRCNGETWHLPPLIPVIDKPVYDGAGRWFGLDLIDQTITFAADGIDFAAVFDAATPIISTVRGVLNASDPAIPVQLPDLDFTLRNPLDFPLSTAPLTIANTLLDIAGATPLAPGPDDGALRSDVWVAPSARPVRMRFGPHMLRPDDTWEPGAGYLPRIDAENDYLAAPNVGHFVASGSSSADQLIGRWRDDDPFSPWGVPQRGRRILAAGSGDAASQEIADDKARRLVMEARGRGRTATIRGAWQPVWPGHVIATDHPDFPDLSARWEVVGVRVSMGLGSDTEWTLREVTG